MRENFDYSDYTVLSMRSNSENYISPDGKYILKLLTSNIDETLDNMEGDIEDNNRILALGIPVPKLLETVKTVDGKIGFIGEYVKEKASVSRSISIKSENTYLYLERFVKLATKIHTTICDTEYFPSIAKKVHEAVETADFLDDVKKRYVHDLVDSVPDEKTCIHGDFQFSNFILSNYGDYAIDVGFFGYGNPVFDWGLLNFMIYFGSDEVLEKMFHMNREKCEECLYISLSMYLKTRDQDKILAYGKACLPFGIAMFIMHQGIIKTKGADELINSALDTVME